MATFMVRPDDMGVDNVDVGNTPAIRKSCHFCRSRKIRCSGQRVCAACSARNLDCVYGREASKGRPRGSTTSSGKNGSNKDPKFACRKSSQNESILSREHSRANSPTLNSSSFSKTYGSPVPQDELISTELERSFRRFFPNHPPFSQESALGSTLFPREPGRAIWEAAVKEEPRSSLQSDSGDSTTTLGTVTYKRLFFGLVPGLVELVSARFGSLGFCQSEDTMSQFFGSSLSMDSTSTMFDMDTQAEARPKFNDHQICQLIELWFFHHPLSFILSKTLLLHSYRSGTHDESLLAAILAGASFAFNEGATKQGHKLFRWAQSQIGQRKAGSLSLSSIQTLILLGWHELCLSRARRGYCYLEMARIAIIDFHTRLNEVPTTEIDWINGVDVGKVELELSQRIYWLTFALELWAALQKDTPFLQPMPSDIEVKFPPLDEASSAVLTLDKESGNIATLGAQEKAMRELWPLSHIASTVESIYALYPRQPVVHSAFPACGWVSQTLPRLRHLLDKPDNLSDVCQRIRDILSDGLDKFRAGMGNHPSEIFTLSVYRTLIIHLLFPRTSSEDRAPQLRSTTLNDTLRFVTAFKGVLQSLNNSVLAQNVLTESSEPNNAQTLVLGLDTCSRALYQLYSLSRTGSPLDQERLILRQVELAELARDLHAVSKHPRLRAVPTLSMVKKSLKCVKECFESQSTGLTPQVSQISDSDPWAASLSTSLSTTGPPLTSLSTEQIMPLIENSAFDLPPDLMSNANVVNWADDEWLGVQNRMTLSGTAPC
ncbi:hypothetical protein ACLMJK_003385 [Lecanora helva]